MEITFINPNYLWLLFIIPLLVLTHFFSLRFSRKKAIKFANFEALSRVTGGHKLSMNLPILFLRFFTLLFLIFALSSPIIWYFGDSGDFNFLIAIDSSGSMLADDFNPNRLEASKIAAKEFLKEVPKGSKISLMVFSGTPFLMIPMTEDYGEIETAIDEISLSYSSGTALGDAIITGTNVLLVEEKGRVLILLTDGQSNVGTVIEKAINYANDNFVTINTIGMATLEGGKFMGLNAISKIDDNTLKSVAVNTGGSYYKATTNDELVRAYKDIAKVSRKKMPLKLSLWLIVLTFITLSIEWVLINTKFRSAP